MAWSCYQIGLALMMVTTGSINTLSAKWADKCDAVGIDGGNARPFEHPFLQATGMFLGEMSCLFVFYAMRLRKRDSDRPEDIGLQGWQNFLFWPAALCDMFATSMMYIGLNLTFASSFQMLRGAVIIFTALLSVAFLGRSVRGYMWLGMSIILGGLVMVGLSDMVFDTSSSPSEMNAVITGDLLIIMAQIITATQMVYEEKVLRKYAVPPLQAVGLEGLFGFCTLGLLLVPMYYIKAGYPFTQDPNNRLENALDAFVQMGNNWKIILATVGNVISIAFFNFCGISVTQEMSATTRMVLDSCRTLVIWAVSLSIGWRGFMVNSFFMQLAGFFLLILGMCLYNDMIIRPALVRHNCCVESEEDADEFKPLLGDDESGRRRDVAFEYTGIDNRDSNSINT